MLFVTFVVKIPGYLLGTGVGLPPVNGSFMYFKCIRFTSVFRCGTGVGASITEKTHFQGKQEIAED